MPGSVYLETSIISYLAAQPSRDLIVAAHQQITHEWWGRRRSQFDLFVSQLVLEEAAAGDSDAAERRLRPLSGIQLLEINEAIRAVARQLLEGIPLPVRAGADSVHIAVVHGMDYLLTWNCTHIANAELRPSVERICLSQGFVAPALCTPDELMGGESLD